MRQLNVIGLTVSGIMLAALVTLGGFAVPNVAQAQEPCDHDKCVTGVALDPACDPCVAQICSVDPFCCAASWDDICVDEVSTICGLLCADHYKCYKERVKEGKLPSSTVNAQKNAPPLASQHFPSPSVNQSDLLVKSAALQAT